MFTDLQFSSYSIKRNQLKESNSYQRTYILHIDKFVNKIRLTYHSVTYLEFIKLTNDVELDVIA